VLAVLTLSASLLVAGLPRTMQSAYDDALRAELDAATVQQTDLVVGRGSDSALDVLSTPQEFANVDQIWWRLLPPELRRITEHGPGSRAHYSAKTALTPVAARVGPGFQQSQFVNLGWLSDADERVRFVAGGPPGPVEPASVPGYSTLPRFDIALVREAAERMDLPLGTVLVLGHSDQVLARVTGIFEPVDGTDKYWQHNADVQRISVRRSADGEDSFHITALISPTALAHLNGESRQLHYQWILPVRTSSGVTARNAESLLESTALYLDRAKVEPGMFGYLPKTGLTNLLNEFLDRLRTAETLLILILGGLLAVALGVIALAVRLLAERAGNTLGMLRARGGSLAQVVVEGVIPVALCTVPFALLGYAASYLVPGPVTPIVHLGPLLIVASALVYCVTHLALAHRRPLRDRRDDVAVRRPSPRRITLEIVVVGMALGGVYLLRSRGLTTSVTDRGSDPFLMLIPVALAVAAALITIRCYPYPLRLIAALVTRRRTAVPFLGFALAARAKPFSTLPVVVLLPALAVSVFAAIMSSAIDTTQRNVAWQRIGADARIESTIEISPAAIERVRRVPGVRTVIPAARDSVYLGMGGAVGTGLAVDLTAYRKILAGTPISVPAPPADVAPPEVSALVSPEFSGNAKMIITWQKQMTIVPKGMVTEMPILGRDLMGVVILPIDANERSGGRTTINTLLIQGTNLDGRSLAAAAGLEKPPLSITVEEELDKITATPLAGAVSWTLQVVTLALAVYALLAVIIMLVISGAERGTALSYLRTLGMSEGQARGLTVLEIAPMIVLTALAGLILGLALPAALGAGIDLSVYTGDISVADYPIDLITPALLTVGLVAVALIGTFAHAAISRRRALGSVLRVGE
jgi:putative ABC transport system permease protein